MATAQGVLDLKWTRPAGLGGSGRGLQVAEVWLFPAQSADFPLNKTNFQ
ncbi:hypothetical protein [Silvibacterium acidisoli]